MWNLDWPELKEILPEGYQLQETEHYIVLIGPTGKEIMAFGQGSTKEIILEELRHFFAQNERC